MKLISKLIILLFLTTLFIPLFAQDELEQPKLKINLSDDGSSYAGMYMVNQIWTRYVWNNPDVNGVQQYGDFDLGIRRSRLFLYAYLYDRVFIYSQLGADNLTYRSPENTFLQLIDAQAEFIFSKNKLHIGLGLNSWNGVSRYNNSDFSQLLVVDNPGFADAVEGTYDRKGSQLGIYARGSLGRFQYRVGLTKPFETGIDSVSTPVTTERINENFAVKGYFNWQFFDKENSLFPYKTMNNLGRRKILDVGLGFYYHPQAMLVEAEKDLSTVDAYLAAFLTLAGQEDAIWELADYYPSGVSDIFLGAADVFLDMPVQGNGAITSYLGYYYCFLGPDYLRSMSTMNLSKMDPELALPQGTGNAQWEVGTGHNVRGETGYLIPSKNIKNRFQPYGAVTWKNFERLDKASFQFDTGINWLMHEHNVKWTLQYSTRPVYTVENEKNNWTSSKGLITLQTQICF